MVIRFCDVIIAFKRNVSIIFGFSSETNRTKTISLQDAKRTQHENEDLCDTLHVSRC